jgi:hypothetical protein
MGHYTFDVNGHFDMQAQILCQCDISMSSRDSLCQWKKKNEQARGADIKAEISLTCMKWLDEHLFTDLIVRQHKGEGGEDREQEEEAVFRNWLPSLSPLAACVRNFCRWILY